MWRVVIVIIVVVVSVGGYKLGAELLRARVPSTPVLASVSALDGTQLVLDQLVIDQDLITVSSLEKSLQMNWDGKPAQSRLVIDPDTLPENQRNGVLYKWLVAVPKGSAETQDLASVRQFCVALSGKEASECYRFSHAPKILAKAAVCGNGQVEDGEICDDGNQIDDDDCTSLCQHPQAASTPFNYPVPHISIQSFADGVLSIFVTLEPYRSDVFHQARPDDLSLRLKADGVPEILSKDSDRLNGYPFIQAILPEGTPVSLDYTYRGVVYETQIIDKLAVGAIPLKGAAPIVPVTASAPTVDVLTFNWSGTEKTLVDEKSRVATDQSDSGHDFSTTVLIQSRFKESVKVVIQLVDQSVSFTHTIAPGASDEVFVNVQRLVYGRHELLMNAVFSDGRKTADNVIPFDYRSAGLLSNSTTLFHYWQWAAAGLLIFFGLLYGWLKLVVFRIRTS